MSKSQNPFFDPQYMRDCITRDKRNIACSSCGQILPKAAVRYPQKGEITWGSDQHLDYSQPLCNSCYNNYKKRS